MECSDIDSSDREEGEIIDDDLEEISDFSIAPSPKTGKLNSPEKNLRAISLSSVSDLDVMDSCSSIHKSKKKMHRSKGRRKKKSRIHYEPPSGSSSEDEEMVKTKKLLREAICRDPEELHNKSLRTRLRQMVQNSLTPSENLSIDCDNLQNELISSEPATIPDDKIKNEEQVPMEVDGIYNTDMDEELRQLRIDALKTALLNKFQKKKRKVKNIDQENSETQDVNKENSCDNVNTPSLTANKEEISITSQVVNNNSQNSAMNAEDEVDVDIMRAVLLASMSKKLTQKLSPSNSKKPKDSVNQKICPKKPLKSSETSTNTHVNVPKIPPVIISINNPDSNSDDDFNETVDENIKCEDKKLEMKIDNFLKQQRAEVEAKSKSTVPKTDSSQNMEKDKIVKINNDYKFLPENKQLEYKNLISKLLKCSEKKKTRVKRISTSRTSENKLQRNKILPRPTDNKSIIRTTQQKQLRQMQQQVNGRLQDKGKYHELSPFLKKMEQVNAEQKKHEIVINRLLKQLSEARSQSLKLQKVFNELMQDYLKKKQEIDNKTKVKPVLKPQMQQTTNFSISKPNTIVSSVKRTQPPPNIPKVQSNGLNCKIILEKCPINLEDPNDIEFRTFTRLENSDVPKYLSPLDFMGSKSHKIMNPMEILCPFEMDGFCRDNNCGYNHCR